MISHRRLLACFTLWLMLCSSAGTNPVFAQAEAETREAARAAAVAALEKVETELRRGWMKETWANRLQAHLHLNEFDKALSILDQTQDNAETWAICFNRVLRFCNYTSNVELLERVAGKINLRYRNSQGYTASLMSASIKLGDLNPVHAVLARMEDPLQQDMFRTALIERICGPEKNMDVQWLEMISQTCGDIEDIPARFHCQSMIANRLVKERQIDSAREILPSNEAYAEFEKACSVEGRPEEWKKNPIAAKWRSRYRHVAAAKAQWQLTQLALQAAIFQSSQSADALEKTRALLTEVGKIEPKYVRRHRIVKVLIDSGLSDLAIDAGSSIEFKRDPFGGGFDDGKHGPFELVTRPADSSLDRLSSRQPLLILLGDFLKQKDFDKAGKLAEAMSDPYWKAVALSKMLGTEGIESWASVEKIPDQLHKLVRDSGKNGNVPYRMLETEEQLLRYELRTGAGASALNRLEEFQKDENAYAALVPLVAHHLFANEQAMQALDLLRAVAATNQDKAVTKTVQELCFDDRLVDATQVFDEFESDENRSQLIRYIALSGVRGGSEMSTLSILQRYQGEEATKPIHLLYRLTDGCRQTKNESMLETLADFAVEQQYDNYEAPLLLSRMHRFQEAMKLAENVNAESAMVFQMLSRQLVSDRAPVELIAECIRHIDKPSRQRWALEQVPINFAYKRSPQEVEQLGKLLEDIKPGHQALYWSGAAVGLAWQSRKSPERK